MDYRKLIKEEIAKLHTAKGVKVNPKLDSDLGEQIVSDICGKVVKNCSIPAVSGQSELLLSFIEHIKKDNELTETVNANDVEAFLKSQQYPITAKAWRSGGI